MTSRRQHNSKSVTCIHKCSLKSDDRSIRCPGFERFGCVDMISSSCNNFKHRCGVGDCFCHCSPCLIIREKVFDDNIIIK